MTCFQQIIVQGPQKSLCSLCWDLILILLLCLLTEFILNLDENDPLCPWDPHTCAKQAFLHLCLRRWIQQCGLGLEMGEVQRLYDDLLAMRHGRQTQTGIIQVRALNNPYAAGGLFDQYKMMQKTWKITETLAHGYSSEGTHRELEKVALALAGLTVHASSSQNTLTIWQYVSLMKAIYRKYLKGSSIYNSASNTNRIKVACGFIFFSFFYVTIKPIQSIHCLKGLLMRNTLDITKVPSLQGVRYFE